MILTVTKETHLKCQQDFVKVNKLVLHAATTQFWCLNMKVVILVYCCLKIIPDGFIF